MVRELPDTLRVVHMLHVRRAAGNRQALDRLEARNQSFRMEVERAVIVGGRHRDDSRLRRNTGRDRLYRPSPGGPWRTLSAFLGEERRRAGPRR